MGGWGEVREPPPTPVGSTGTTGQIEAAHKELDRRGVAPGPLGARVLELPKEDLVEDCSCGDRTRVNINHRTRIPCWTYVGPRRVEIDMYGRVVGGYVPVAVSELRWWREKLMQTVDPEHHSAEWRDAVRLVVHGIERELNARHAGSPAVPDPAPI